MAKDGIAFNKVVKTGIRWSGFPALPVGYGTPRPRRKGTVIDTLTIDYDVFGRGCCVAPAQQKSRKPDRVGLGARNRELLDVNPFRCALGVYVPK
jgi:hypothetical protein